MKRNLMVFTAIASLLLPLAAPVVAAAQDRGDRGRQAQREGEGRPQRSQTYVERRATQAQAERDSTPTQERPDRRRDRREDRPDRPQRPSEPRQPQRPDRPDRPAQPDTPSRPTTQDRESRRDRSGPGRDQRPNRPDTRRDDRQDRRDDNRYDRRQDRRDDRRDNNQYDRRNDRQDHRSDRRQDRRDYQEFRNRFDSNRWRSDFNRSHRSDWWRSDRRFRNYSGVRIGFYFAPGYGYYNVPRSYWGQRWQVGSYLPSMFWRYQLDDWRTFGLGYPPAGTRWVVVDNQIYLIDEYDGYIIDVIYDAWRW